MSLKRSSSSNPFPTFPSVDTTEQKKSSLNEKEKADEKGAEKKQSSMPDSKNEKEQVSPVSPRINMRETLARRKLRKIEQGTANPLLVHPVANASDQARPSSLTSDAKSTSVSEKTKDPDTLAPAPSPKSANSSVKISTK